MHGVSLRLNYFKLLQFIKMLKDKNHKESKKYLSSLTAKMIMIKIIDLNLILDIIENSYSLVSADLEVWKHLTR